MKGLLYTAFVLIFLAPLVSADRIVQAGVTVIRNGVDSTQNVTRIKELKIYLPAGFGVATEPFSRRSKACATVNNVEFVGDGPLPDSLVLTREHFGVPTNTNNRLYPLPDRIPVRFATDEIVWTSATGSFTFNTEEELQYRDQVQLLLLQVARSRMLPGALEAVSNGLYYLGSKGNNRTYEIRARAGGAASLHQVEIDLDPFKFSNVEPLSFRTHFPELVMSWTSTSESRIIFENDEIDRSESGLRGASATFISYARAIQPADCEDEPILSEQVRCRAENNRWYFTRDGGLHANCILNRPGSSEGVDIEWMGFRDEGVVRFGKKITTLFTAGNLMTGGLHVQNDLLNIAAGKKVGALTHSGHSLFDLVPGTERPRTSKYGDGLADYPGLNLRCGDQVYMAESIIAARSVPAYPLESGSKYYLRSGGVSGLHLGDSDEIEVDGPCGSEFLLSAMRLSFLDSLNIFSRVEGMMNIPYPSDIQVALESIRFGPQMQFESAEIGSTQGSVILNAWSLECEPLALDFPQPPGCANPDEAFPRLTVRSVLTRLTSTPLIGALGFCNGNIIAESDDESYGVSPLSRFAVSGNLKVRGPGESFYDVSPVSGIAVSKRPDTDPNGSPGWQGLLSVGGLMDLPFFVDLPVALVSSSDNVIADPDSDFDRPAVRSPWEDLEKVALFDIDHRGLPGDVDGLSDYRTNEEYDPEVYRDWQDLIEFRFPVVLEADGYFRSRGTNAEDLFLFRFAQAVKSISPDNAELVFDGNFSVDFANLIPQLSLSTLLNNHLDNFDLFNGAFQANSELDLILNDNPVELLKPALREVVAGVLQGEDLTSLTRSELESLLGEVRDQMPNLMIDGGWKDELISKIQNVRTGLGDLKAILEQGSQIEALVGQLSNAIEGQPTPSVPEESELEAALAPVVALICQIDEQLRLVEEALDGTLLNDFLEAELDGALSQVDEAVEELVDEWTNPLILANADPAELVEDMTCAALAQLLGTEFLSGYSQLIWINLGDSRDLVRQAIDDAIRKMETYFIEALAEGLPAEKALGDLSNFVAGGSLRGYARINGDSLHEIRIDGEAEFSFGKEQEGDEEGSKKMKFAAWFLFRNLESATPGTSAEEGELECLRNAGVAAEVGMGAEADVDWGGIFTLGITVGGKVAISEENRPIGFTADFALRGSFDFGEVALHELKLGVGAGAGNGYFYGAASGEVSLMSVSVGIFIGQTCNVEVIRNADPDIGAVLAQENVTVPIAGLVVYAEGGMSLMPIIGIKPSCFLDVRVHGGQGFLFFVGLDPNVDGYPPTGEFKVGVKFLQGVSAELLCLVNVRGDFAAAIIGSGRLDGPRIVIEGISGAATATLKGKIGIGVFSVSFKAMARLIVSKQMGQPLKFSFES